MQINCIHGKLKGFTLIEVLITVTIIGLLASIAIPYYTLYLNRAKFSEVILATSIYKNSIEVVFTTRNKNNLNGFDGGKLGIPENNSPQIVPHKYISKATVTNGVIYIESTITLNGINTTYILTPIIKSDNTLAWNTSGNCIDAGLC